MKWFNNMKISVRLIMGFLIIAAIAGVIGVVGIVNIREIDNADTLLYTENTLGLAYSGSASTEFQRIRVNAMKLVTIETEVEREAAVKKIGDYRLNVDDLLLKYDTTISSDDVQKMYNTLTSQWEQYEPYIDEAIKLVNTNQYEQARRLIIEEAVELENILNDSFSALMANDALEAKQRSDGNTDLANTSVTMMVITIIIGIIVSIILGLFVARTISTPIKVLIDAADKLAVGDVGVNINNDRKDELGMLLTSFEKMINNIRGQAYAAERIAAGDLTIDVEVRSEADLLGKKLAEMVNNNNELLSDIANASEQVAVGAKQVSDASITLSEGATEQASSIEELTASIEEISSQIQMNAKNSSQANDLAENAKENAIRGNEQMQGMLKAMEEINESSTNISKIIKVIDEIAFQTNILALNAAVEAARAGQHGKGFAVVAEEVRNLAARSANAAKETTDMIEGSIRKAEGGTKIARETAEALGKIVTGIEKAAKLVGDIATASNEQAVGVEQINQGIMQVSQVVQANSATSEESAAASEELSSQADLLKQTVGKFKLKKIANDFNKYDEFNPEVLRMLEKMSRGSSKVGNKHHEDYGTSKPQIVLSDKEFGKY
ncbi:MAG: methyl-accepting chemotaxis sensory transducer [Clostridiales bacterium]|jgi:methyl-accepting chemotaxis protein|nr:methyl-accepting chemotaxis sensory transducer [Clostridiales bacterium]